MPTNIPTNIPTSLPSVDNNPNDNCLGWNIIIQFILIEYNETDIYWRDKLKNIFLNTFILTIKNKIKIWDNKYCCIIDEILFKILSNHRRLLLQNNIEINITFMINDILYSDSLSKYNITEFAIDFKTNALNKLSNDINNIEQLNMLQPMNIITPSPINSNINGQRKQNESTIEKIIIVMIILGLLIICVFIAMINVLIRNIVRNQTI